jgi:hypothetical protein
VNLVPRWRRLRRLAQCLGEVRAYNRYLAEANNELVRKNSRLALEVQTLRLRCEALEKKSGETTAR